MAGYMKIGDIKGESKQSDHKDWIELNSFSWGASNSGSSSAAGGGKGAGKVSVQDLHFTKRIDKSSPLLMQACATGRAQQSVTLHVCRTKDDQQTYLEYTFEDCLISSYQTSSSSETEAPSEALSLSFTKLEMAYTEIDCSTNRPMARHTGHLFVKI